MEKTEVQARIDKAIPDADIQVEGDGCNFSVLVLSPQFGNVAPVKRQQQILACFSDLLRSGALHALTVKAHTPAEWKELQRGRTVQFP